MLFRTELLAPKNLPTINFNSQIVLIGSCFSDNIGNWLKSNYFNVLSNPFGTVFNPISIQNYFTADVNNLVCNHTIYANKNWASLHHHSSNNQLTEQALTEHLTALHNRFKKSLNTSTHLFVTLGTSWVYKFNVTKQIVANCQKLPADNFEKYLLSVQEIYQSLEKIIHSVADKTPVVLTVSPVRHIKDGMLENTRSKARLIEAIYLLMDKFPKQVFYFPVYEWFIDDLRDYRFYNSDLVHPNEQGIQYVTEKFKESFITEETLPVLALIQQYNQLKNHRLFSNHPENQKSIQKKLYELDESIKKINPNILLPK